MTFLWHPEIKCSKIILSQKEIDNLILLFDEAYHFVVTYDVYVAIQINSQINDITTSYNNRGNPICSWDINKFKDRNRKDILVRFPNSNNYEYYKLDTVDRYINLKIFL